MQFRQPIPTHLFDNKKAPGGKPGASGQPRGSVVSGGDGDRGGVVAAHGLLEGQEAHRVVVTLDSAVANAGERVGVIPPYLASLRVLEEAVGDVSSGAVGHSPVGLIPGQQAEVLPLARRNGVSRARVAHDAQPGGAGGSFRDARPVHPFDGGHGQLAGVGQGALNRQIRGGVGGERGHCQRSQGDGQKGAKEGLACHGYRLLERD
ncbi:hypothetical protein G6F40_014413 [Rhizopus arrhizus]|nr:hypothetical protein G6F40_014413 [Rhizopus arrhizus]